MRGSPEKIPPTGNGLDSINVITGKIPCSFLLEDQIYTTFGLKRLGIFSLDTDSQKACTSPIFFSSRKAIFKASILLQWKLSFKVAEGEEPSDGFPSPFTTTIVSPATFSILEL